VADRGISPSCRLPESDKGPDVSRQTRRRWNAADHDGKIQRGARWKIADPAKFLGPIESTFIIVEG